MANNDNELQVVMKFFSSLPALQEKMKNVEQDIKKLDIIEMFNDLRAKVNAVEANYKHITDDIYVSLKVKSNDIEKLKKSIADLDKSITDNVNEIMGVIKKNADLYTNIIGGTEEEFKEKIEENIKGGCQHLISYYHNDTRVLKERIERMRKALYVIYKIVEPDSGVINTDVIEDALFGTIKSKTVEETIDVAYDKIKKGKKKKKKSKHSYESELLDVLKTAYVDLESRVSKLEDNLDKQ